MATEVQPLLLTVEAHAFGLSQGMTRIWRTLTRRDEETGLSGAVGKANGQLGTDVSVG
eukprot:CAMPEP_0117514856 /NCGR_PEP_ID=MMETSP0784-20121206/30281_1 /TAXON_ID=39447 /ORGANISM="" /LENGTH=57 /DNA_ID=CAMNT_0005310657 /DNA_START=403 /DNA_END=576 /DNA_ORIENTATION=-